MAPKYSTYGGGRELPPYRGGSDTPIRRVVGNPFNQPNRSSRTVGENQISNPPTISPGAISRRFTVPLPASITGEEDALGGFDRDTQRELDRIGLEGQLALAKYAQDVGVANANADFDRRQVQREIGITGDAGQIASTNSAQSYADLIANLGTITPQTEQAYATGVQGISDAYNSGVQNVQNAPSNTAALAAQLEALSPGGAAQVIPGYEQPRNDIAALLAASGAAGSAGLQSQGAQDVLGARNMIPGFNVEGQERQRDIRLDTDSQLSMLRNELAGIHPQFVGFNMGALQLQQQRDIENAIRTGRAREEEDLSPLEEVARYLHGQGADDLYGEFMSSQAASREGITTQSDPVNGMQQPATTLTGDEALYYLINNYTVPQSGGAWSPSRYITGRDEANENERMRNLLRHAVEIYNGRLY